MANDCEIVLMHMKMRGSISHKEAEEEYGIMRLAARIKDLRNRGIAIKSEPYTAPNRRGGKSRYARYSLVEENHDAG